MKVCTSEDCTRAQRLPERGSHQIGFGQTCLVQIGSGKIGITEISVAEIGIPQACPTQVGMTEVSFAQVLQGSYYFCDTDVRNFPFL